MSINEPSTNQPLPRPGSGNEKKRKRSSSPVPIVPTELTSSLGKSAGPTSLLAGETVKTLIPLSKNQQKKLLKKQRWEESRESRRALRREKMAAKRLRQREEPNTTGTGQTPSGEQIASKKRKNNRKLERKSKRVGIKCIVDCSFDDLMVDKEVASLGAQVSRCYSDNRVAKFSMELWITCVNKRLRSHLDLMHGDKWRAWRKIQVTDMDYEASKEDVDQGNIIYLSSDSDETLEKLEEGRTYIVGGIVDKNRYKGLCYNKAVGQGLRTAKLPIGEYIKMTGRVTLTTNQVVEIMLRWLELRDWKSAFENVIPMRKKKVVPEDQSKEDQVNAEESQTTSLTKQDDTYDDDDDDSEGNGDGGKNDSSGAEDSSKGTHDEDDRAASVQVSLRSADVID